MILKKCSVLFFLFVYGTCYSQKANSLESKFFKEKTIESIWIPSTMEESYMLRVSDTCKSEINLIFQMNFNDSIKIFVDSCEIFSTRVVTVKNLAVVDQEFRIKFTEGIVPRVSMYLIEKEKQINFTPPKGYILIYLSRHQGTWSIEYSNYQRMYY